MSCPGCGGSKSKRAKLCAGCRRRANAIGEKVWTDTHVPPAPTHPRTAKQSVIYYGKCSAIAKAEAEPHEDKIDVARRMRAVKRRALEYASTRFNREITSSTELTDIEMDIVCEHLDEILDQVEAESTAP